MLHWKRWLATVLLLVVAAVLLGACAAAPTPTPTAKPVAATPTKAPAASPTPTKVAIRWEDGKLQPLPDGFPKQPINFYVGTTGSGSDISIRELVKFSQPGSPVPLAVKNNPGSTLGWFKAARDANKEGYAVVYLSPSLLVDNYVSGDNLVLGKDYRPVMMSISSDPIFAVKADAPWKTMKEFLDYARANPGLRIGLATSGSIHHLQCEWVGKEAGTKWTCLPHEGSGDVMRSILAGDIPGGFTSLPPTIPQVEAGKARVLATGASKKLDKFPDVPRYTDLGYKTQIDQFRGVVAPGEVSDLHVQWLSALLLKATEDPGYAQYAAGIGERVLAYDVNKAESLLKELDPAINQLTKELGMR